MQNLIELSDAVVRNHLVRFDEPLAFSLGVNEHLAVIGANAAGKSVLIDTMLGKYPLCKGSVEYDFSPSVSNRVCDNVKYLAFRDSYGTADVGYYHQQRWNSTELDSVPTVREQLGKVENEVHCDHLFRLFQLDQLIDKKVILLSGGELRKFQLIKALVSNPRLLIIDNPFIGLDTEMRRSLRLLLTELSSLKHLQIVLVVSMPSDIPDFITHVIPVKHKKAGIKVTRKIFFDQQGTQVHQLRINTAVLPSFATVKEAHSDEVVRLSKVSIRYGERLILNKLDWTVYRGEKWALKGENGAGKSTLLSLICADNPQSYACDIRLFGLKRGSGESIWDIKKKIGYVSPEMHRAYLKNIPAVQIVASGLYDSIGFYRQMKPEDAAVCKTWMEVFGILHLADKSFLQLSSGEQRLTLLARAFVKTPELLILDEPLHGLDMNNRIRVKAVIEAYGRNQGKTLIMVTHYEEDFPSIFTQSLRLERIM